MRMRHAKSIAELAEENVLVVVSRSLFIEGRVINLPRDEVLMSLQVPTVRQIVMCGPLSSVPATWRSRSSDPSPTGSSTACMTL